MKLLKKYRRYTYTSLILVVLVGFTINYYLFRFSIHRTTDDVLNEYRYDIEDYAKQKGTLSEMKLMKNKFYQIFQDVPIDEDINGDIVDTLVYSHYEQEMVVYRKIDFFVKADDGNYLIKLMLPTLEEDDLLETVAISLMAFVILFILFTTIIDRSITVKILNPFFKFLKEMESYNVGEQLTTKVDDKGIDEYRQMMSIFYNMDAKINHSYDEIKNFLEHTSHEMKTPLAIIQLKLEHLSQKEFNDEETIMCISSINSALNRIVRYNRSLLFIARIKNNQFNNASVINFNNLILQLKKMYYELIMQLNINCEIKEDGDFIMKINLMLAEQLIQNVFINAIRFNYNKGNIKIGISENEISFTNTFEGNLPEGDLFEKYRYSLNKKDSTGLGLAIVRNICEKNRLSVNYKVINNLFVIIIRK